MTYDSPNDPQPDAPGPDSSGSHPYRADESAPANASSKRVPALTAAIAAIAGIIIGVAVALIGGTVATQTSPSTNLDSFQKTDGFVSGSTDYGTRDNSGADQS